MRASGQVRRATPFRALVCAGGLSPLVAVSAWADGCTSTTYTDPPREVLDCAGGTRITAEPGATYRLIDRDRDGRPEAVELGAKALLIQVTRRPRGGFQVLTPHAVAAVRGTT